MCFQEQIHFIKASAKWALSDIAIPCWQSQWDTAVIESKILRLCLSQACGIIQGQLLISSIICFSPYKRRIFLEDTINYWNCLAYLSLGWKEAPYFANEKPAGKYKSWVPIPRTFWVPGNLHPWGPLVNLQELQTTVQRGLWPTPNPQHRPALACCCKLLGMLLSYV